MSAPVPINVKGSEEITAPIVDFGDYAREAPQIYEDSSIRNVTVLGGGKAAYDIVYLMATHGKQVTCIIRASGHGPTYMAPAQIYIGPFRCWLEKLTTTRPLTWLSPCFWGDADGFQTARNLLHVTSWGRWFVDTFWAKMTSDTLDQSGILKTEATKVLVPDQPMFWYGVSLAILNYPKAIYGLVSNGQYLFRKDAKNRGKVYTGGVWGVIRHPNFLGFTIWSTAFATAAGGWGFGLLALAMFAYILCGTSVRVLEGYMDGAYGKEWQRATEKVRWKMVPGIW